MQPRIPKVRTGKRVAVVGSGPSGLAVADQLNHRGHSVTVFERSDRIGGLLMYGIPNMKLEKKIVQRRVDLMTEEGVTFVTGADVGNTTSAQSLLDEFDAVVLCCGASNPRDLTGPGRDECQGIYFAVDFLKANTKSLLDSNLTDGKFISCQGQKRGHRGRRRHRQRLCRYRHPPRLQDAVTAIEMMPKSPDKRSEDNPWPEWPHVCKTDYGHEEAIAVFGSDPRLYQTTVKEYIPDEQGNLKAVKIVHLKPEKDKKTGRTNMVEIPGTEELPCDILLIAAGFLGSQKYVSEAFGVELDGRSNVRTESGHYKTNVEKVFAAGDMHRGQSLVVWGVAEGRGAAREVDEYLMGYTELQ